MSLIDKEQFINEMNTRAEEEVLDFIDIRDMVEFAPTVKAVPINKLKELIDKMVDEKDYAYANFDEYKMDVLGCDDVDDLPNDDYRFGLNRAIKLLQLLIAESEVNNE